MNPDVNWLEALFSSYDLYYLDPLIIKDAAPPDLPPTKQEDKITKASWFQSDIEATSAVLAEVREILGVDSSNPNISQFFDEHILAKLSEDRGKQKQIVDTLTNGLSPLVPLIPKIAENTKSKNRARARQMIDALVKRLRPQSNLEKQTVCRDRIVDDPSDLDRKLDLFQSLPNRGTVECLVALEGKITCVDAGINPALYQSVVVTPRHDDHYVRTVRFCLSERPGRLMSLDDWRIGLMVDQKGLAKTYPIECGSEAPLNRVALDGWYPFAKAIGFWRTDRGGRAFIDILAILIKAFPSMDRILMQRVPPDQRCFVQMLKNGRDTADERREGLHGGSPYDPKDDCRLIYPYVLATLCCHLNNTDWKDFENRGRLLFNLSNEYWKALVDLSEEIRAKEAMSWLPDLVESEKTRRG